MARGWFVQKNHKIDGPISSRRLQAMAVAGQLESTDLVRREDMDKWVPASRVQGLSFEVNGLDLTKFDSTTSTRNERDIIATTKDGREVVLSPDGSWRLSDTAHVKPEAIIGATTNRASPNATSPVPPFSRRHFREVRWGMSEREVRATETDQPIHTSKNALVYNGSVAGLPCNVIYIFARDKCVRGKFQLLPTHSNENEYISDYENIKELLINKYGPFIGPSEDNSDYFWRNDLYTDDYQNWGMAVSIGHLVFMSKWQTEDTDIGLILSGDNYEVTLIIEYVSKEFESLEDIEIRESKLADL